MKPRLLSITGYRFLEPRNGVVFAVLDRSGQNSFAVAQRPKTMLAEPRSITTAVMVYDAFLLDLAAVVVDSHDHHIVGLLMVSFVRHDYLSMP